MQTFQANSTAAFYDQINRNIFRLAMILCLFLALKPYLTIKQYEKPAVQEGLGGGTFTGEVISAVDANMLESPQPLDTVEMEPESFSTSHILLYNTHIVKSGENISGLAVTFGLNQDTLISVNKITNTRLLQIGQVLKIPNQDGVLHFAVKNDTLGSIAEKYKSDPEAIKIANELFTDNIRAGTDLFIPGAKLDWVRLQEINGDLFIWPVSGHITSPYGYRRSPFTGRRQFHNGMDIKANSGAPIRAAMSGRVSTTGYDNVLGNFVVISHHSGYRTLYGHMSIIRVKAGSYVGTGERIGDVGSTGQSTGSHVHFTVYKNGVTVNPRSLLK